MCFAANQFFCVILQKMVIQEMTAAARHLQPAIHDSPQDGTERWHVAGVLRVPPPHLHLLYCVILCPCFSITPNPLFQSLHQLTTIKQVEALCVKTSLPNPNSTSLFS